MKPLVRIDVACNDPDNGAFAGRTMMINYGDVEIEADDWNGYRFSVLDDGRFRLHRRVFRFRGRKYWIGNWCWDGFWLDRSEAKRLLGLLRDSSRWRCTCAPSRFYDWFNREGWSARPAKPIEGE